MMPGLLQGSGTQPEEGAGPQPGYPPTPLHSGSRFTGFQQSKGNRYQVEVIFKVRWVCHDMDGPNLNSVPHRLSTAKYLVPLD